MKFLLLCILLFASCQLNTIENNSEEQNSLKDSNQESQEQKEFYDLDGNQQDNNEFEIDNFLNQIDKIGCKIKHTTDDEQIYYTNDEKCLKSQQKKALEILGQPLTDQNHLFAHLQKNVYQPLGYKMNQPPDISATLLDAHGLSVMPSILADQPINIKYQTFEQNILQSFLDISSKISNLDAFEPALNELVISVLKKCHIYWNSLRAKNQLSQAHIDTKNLFQTISKIYEVRQLFLKEVTKVMLHKIKNAYFKFLRADNLKNYLNSQMNLIISEKIVERYSQIIDKIKYSESDYIMLTREMGNQLDFLESYFIVLYRSGLNEPLSIREFQIQIFDRIVNIYVGVKSINEHNDKLNTKQIKEFTATLLLKMKHLQFIVFSFQGIADFTNIPGVEYSKAKDISVKVIEDLKDNLMLVPKTCVNFLILQKCTLQEMNRVMHHIASKYMLKRSTMGWRIYNILVNALKYTFTQATDLVWKNFNLYKNFYYQHVFLVIQNMTKKFLIVEDESIEALNSMIGQAIKVARETRTKNEEPDFGLIDQLDLKLYDKMLELKGKYNKFVPYQSDPQILTSIQNDLFIFLQQNLNKVSRHVNINFLRLIKSIKKIINDWKIKQIKGEELQDHMTTLPLNAKALFPKFTHIVKKEVPRKLVKKEEKKITDFDVAQALKITN